MSPTRLEEFPTTTGQSRYDWDQLLDGSPWELIAGTDFQAKPTTFAGNARQQGVKRGGRVRIRHFQKEQPERLVIQFVKD